jgi:hypothetical protein
MVAALANAPLTGAEAGQGGEAVVDQGRQVLAGVEDPALVGGLEAGQGELGGQQRLRPGRAPRLQPLGDGPLPAGASWSSGGPGGPGGGDQPLAGQAPLRVGRAVRGQGPGRPAGQVEDGSPGGRCPGCPRRPGAAARPRRRTAPPCRRSSGRRSAGRSRPRPRSGGRSSARTRARRTARGRRPRWPPPSGAGAALAVVLARLRMPLIYLGLAAIAVDGLLCDLPAGRCSACWRPPSPSTSAWDRAPDAAGGGVPVAGRWLAMNSPADRVPSHHLHAYGQTYAIDLVHEPAGASARAGLVAPGPAAGRLPRVRPAGARPGRRHGGAGPRPRARPLEPHLGAGPALPGPRGRRPRAARARADPRQPRRARPRRRGLCRPGPPAPRLPPGPARRPGRRRPAAGRVRDSGNSTEPHLHFQLMDHPSVLLAAGLPLRFDQVGVPHNLQPFAAPAQPLAHSPQP